MPAHRHARAPLEACAPACGAAAAPGPGHAPRRPRALPAWGAHLAPVALVLVAVVAAAARSRADDTEPVAPATILDEAVVPAGAVVPATPIAPGQGPSFDEFGAPWDEQRPAGSPPFWYARGLAATWVSKNGADGFGTTDVPLSTALAPVWFDDLPALLVTPGFGFHFWQAPDALELPSTVFDAYVDVVWRTPLTDTLGFGFGITPGVYGDYRRSSPKAFQLTGWGLVDWRITPALSLVAGAAVVRQLDMHVLPVGGLIWTPDEAHRLELLVPRSRVARRMWSAPGGGGLWAYGAVQFGGGSWAVTLPDDKTALVTVSDLRALVGLEWFLTRRVAGVAEAGWVFARTISADGVPEFNPTDGLMLSAGATF